MKIKNILDVITNSSSEVFILKKEDADELLKTHPWLDSQEIDETLLRESFYAPLYCKAIGLESKEYRREEWISLLTKHSDEFSTLLGHCLVDVDDHKWPEYLVAVRDASINCLSQGSTHNYLL